MMRFLDTWLSDMRWWRRLRGGQWTHYVLGPVPQIMGWRRNETLLSSEIEIGAEDYRHPRAKALPAPRLQGLPDGEP